MHLSVVCYRRPVEREYLFVTVAGYIFLMTNFAFDSGLNKGMQRLNSFQRSAYKIILSATLIEEIQVIQ